MAEVLLDVSFETADDAPLVLGAFFRQFTESLARWNQTMLPRWNLPPLYRSGVRYVASKVQRLPDALAIKRQGFADCGPLAAWRAAELRVHGEPATIRIYWRPIRGGQRLFHAQVRRADGRIEDPSRLLGMPTHG
jgi:hypothetical protein